MKLRRKQKKRRLRGEKKQFFCRAFSLFFARRFERKEEAKKRVSPYYTVLCTFAVTAGLATLELT